MKEWGSNGGATLIFWGGANICIIGQPVMDQWMDERITAHQVIQASGLRPFFSPRIVGTHHSNSNLWTLDHHLAKFSYFTNLDFPEIRGPIPFLFATFCGFSSCDVLIIWPDHHPSQKKNDFSLYLPETSIFAPEN